MSLGRRSKTGWKARGKKRIARLVEEYEPWALEGFSGYLAADELYDGPFCVLSAVDSKQQRRLAYEVLDHNPTHEDIRRFFHRVDAMLTSRGLAVAGITTDGSPLYPDPIRDIWPNAAHQVCEFHVLKEITKDILRALAKKRKSLAKDVPSLSPGRPRTPQQKAEARRAKRLRDQITELFDHRHLVVQRDLTPAQGRILRRLGRRYPEVQHLRQLMDAVYGLFDRRCRMHTALARLAKLRRKLDRFKHLGKVLSKLRSTNLDKALTFLDDKLLEATSNSVERGNRRHRKMQKSVYRVRTQKSLIARMALDLFRDKERVESTAISMEVLHALRTHAVNAGMGELARRSC